MSASGLCFDKTAIHFFDGFQLRKLSSGGVNLSDEIFANPSLAA